MMAERKVSKIIRSRALSGIVFTSRIELAVITILYITSRTIAFVLNAETKSLAPDEVTYALQALWYANGSDMSSFPGYEDDSLFRSSLSLVVPAGQLVKLGIDSLLSVQLMSCIYGLFSVLFFWTNLTLLAKYFPEHTSNSIIKLRFLFSLIFTLWPSYVLWSVSGLRETATICWFSLTLYGVLRLYVEDLRLTLAWLSISSGMCLLFLSRPQTGYLAYLAFLTSLIVTFALRGKRPTVSKLAVTISLLSLSALLGSNISLPTRSVAAEFGTLKPQPYLTSLVNPTLLREAKLREVKSPKPIETNNSLTTPVALDVPKLNLDVTTAPTANAESLNDLPKLVSEEQSTSDAGISQDSTEDGSKLTSCSKSDEVLILEEGVFICRLVSKKNNSIEIKAAKQSQVLITNTLKRGISESETAVTKIQNNCRYDLSLSTNNFNCILRNFPSRLFQTYFLPLDFSLNSLFTRTIPSIENLFWIILLAFFSFGILHQLRDFHKSRILPTLPIIFNFTLYFIALAASSTNYGTSFRHKIFLLPLALLYIPFFLSHKTAKSHKLNFKHKSLQGY
jgi:hypothetical protein